MTVYKPSECNLKYFGSMYAAIQNDISEIKSYMNRFEDEIPLHEWEDLEQLLSQMLTLNTRYMKTEHGK